MSVLVNNAVTYENPTLIDYSISPIVLLSYAHVLCGSFLGVFATEDEYVRLQVSF
jgi:hypothetical protein